jgi:hypothetical protein
MKQYNYESYMLNEENMKTFLSKKKENIFPTKKACIVDSCKSPEQTIIKQNVKKEIFIPNQADTLFWCYYIITRGDCSYEILQNKNQLIAKQLKIEYIDKIRKNKSILKTYKFDSIVNIENNLVNENYTNIKTIISLFAIDKINIVFISLNTYFELLFNEQQPIYIIREIRSDNSYVKKYGFEIATPETLESVRGNLYQIEHLCKPIKACSSYKVTELLTICNKLRLNSVNEHNGKNKTKPELYELIVKYFM